MEKAVKAVTGIVVEALEESHDVVVMGGDKIFMFHDKSPVLISIETADNVVIRTKSGSYEYPPSVLPPGRKLAKATVSPKRNKKVPPLFKGYDLKAVKKVVTTLGVEKIISGILPDKPKRADYINAFAELFSKAELANNLDLITAALTAGKP